MSANATTHGAPPRRKRTHGWSAAGARPDDRARAEAPALLVGLGERSV
jgi:hypothetical protein